MVFQAFKVEQQRHVYLVRGQISLSHKQTIVAYKVYALTSLTLTVCINNSFTAKKCTHISPEGFLL